MLTRRGSRVDGRVLNLPAPGRIAQGAVVFETVRQAAQKAGQLAYQAVIDQFEEKRDYPSQASGRKRKRPPSPKKKISRIGMAGFKKAISRTSQGGGGGKTNNKRRLPVRGGKGYVSPAVKKFVRASAKALDVRKDTYGKVNTNRQINTGKIEETAYNVAKYTYIYGNTSATLEGYLGTGIRRLAFNAAHTAVTSQSMPADFDATNRPHGEYGLKIAGGYKKIMIRNNDLIDISVDVMLFKCVENTGTSLNDYFVEAVEQKHFADSTNENSPVLHIMQFTNYFSNDWVPQKNYRKRVILKPGEQVNFTYPVLKGEFDSTYFNKHKSSSTYTKGCSQVVCIRTVGSICHDTVDDGLVGYSKHTLDYVWHREIRWRAKQPVEQRAARLTETLDTITQGEAAGEDDAMDQPR